MPTRAKSPSRKPTKSKPAKAMPAKAKARGGAALAVNDLQALAVPFALTLLSRANDKKPKSGGAGDIPSEIPAPLDTTAADPGSFAGGAKKAKKTSSGAKKAVPKKNKASIDKIRSEFLDITSQIHRFLSLY